MRKRTEIESGFVFELSDTGISSFEIVEWIGMENRCCPFLLIQCSTAADSGQRFLKMTGPLGVKRLILQEFSF